MSASLFELTSQYRAAAEHLADLSLDEQTVADSLESLSGDLETKASNVALMALSLEGSAAAIREHVSRMTARSKAMDARAESLRAYLSMNLKASGITKVEALGVRIAFRKSTAVIVDGVDLLPAAFMRQPETPPRAPDKAALAAALKAGANIPGARLEYRTSLVIS